MQVSPRCFAVTGLAYSTPWFVNAGFIVGDHTTLIVDTGGNAAAAVTIHGYATIARPGNTLRVINTEKHFDHLGGNSFFHDRGIPIWGHTSTVRTAAEFQTEVEDFNAGISNPVRRARREAQAFFENTALVNPMESLTADTTWNLGNLPVEILLTPGHTSSNLTIWVPDERVLFTGDCLIRSYLPNLEGGGPAEWRLWLNSLARLKRLDAQVVICGHGPISRGTDIPEVIAQMERALTEALQLGRAPTVTVDKRSN